MLNRNIARVALSVLFYVAPLQWAASQTQSPRTAISAAPVVGALGSAGLGVAASQLQFLSRVDANGQTPALRVVSIESMSADTAKVKLRCLDAHECIPFYVLVHGVKRSSTPAKPLVAKHERPVVETARLVVRNGEHATLILETSDLRISLPVVCLQSGTPGQTIRVTSSDRQRFYQAEVVAPGMLKGSF